MHTNGTSPRPLPGTTVDSLKLLDPGAVAASTSAAGTLCLVLDGVRHEDVRPSLAFPLTRPREWLFFIADDDTTLGYVASLDSLKDATRQAVEAELHLHYYATTVKAIAAVSSRHGITSWDMATNHGARTVHVKDRGDIRHLHTGMIIFTDAHGMKFVIPDRHKLDANSLMLLDSES